MPVELLVLSSTLMPCGMFWEVTESLSSSPHGTRMVTVPVVWVVVLGIRVVVPDTPLEVVESTGLVVVAKHINILIQ